MNLNKIVAAAALRMAGVSVDVDDSLPSVAIDDDIFMQGDDAQSFIDEANQLYETAGKVSMQQCYECLAEPYIN